MTDESSKGGDGAPNVAAPADPFPPANMPTAYADSVSSLSFSGENFKFYLSRNDTHLLGQGGFKLNPFLQIVMPISGFITFMMSAHSTIDDLVALGIIPKEMIDTIKNGIEEFKKAHPPLTSANKM